MQDALKDMPMLQPEPDPEQDTDFDEKKYACAVAYDQRVPHEKRKPQEFFTDDVPNIDRLKSGRTMYESALELIARDSVPPAIPLLEKAISLLEQYVHYKYDDATLKMLHAKKCEYLVDAYCHLAFCYQKDSRYKLAKVYYVRSMKLLKEQYDHGEQLAQVAMNLCEVYNMLQKPQSAATIARIHLPLCEKFFDPVHYAGALSNSSIYFADCKDFESAIYIGNNGLELFTEKLGRTHPITVRFLNIYLKMLATKEDRDLYNINYEEYHEFTKIPTYDEMRAHLQNPNSDVDKHQQEKEEIDQYAASIMPQLEKASEILKTAKQHDPSFSSSMAGDFFQPFDKKE